MGILKKSLHDRAVLLLDLYITGKSMSAGFSPLRN